LTRATRADQLVWPHLAREFRRWLNSFETISAAVGFMYLNMKTKISLIQNSKITAAFLGAVSVIATYFVCRAVLLGLQVLQMIDDAWRVGLS
jgi:hypothetical protein